MSQLRSRFDDFLRSMKRGENTGTYDLCRKTCAYLLSLIKQHEITCVEDISSLVASISSFGQQLSSTLPLEIAVANIVHRVLHIIRENAQSRNIDLSKRITTLKGLILDNLPSEDPLNTTPASELIELRQEIKDEVKNLIEELKSHDSNISKQAVDHINNNEIILTYGFSSTVLQFLIAAKTAGRKYEVLVSECAPLLTGHQMCKELASKGLETTLITDSAVFALMSRVNKVIIGTRALMANGGLLTEAGIYGVCLAAQAHCVPVLVTCGLFKLSPVYPFDQDTFNEYLSPNTIADRPNFREVEFINYSVPAFDYIPPELISLYVTDVGGKMCSYLYRLLSEYYSLEDYNLFN